MFLLFSCAAFLLLFLGPTLFWGKNDSTSYPNGPRSWPLVGNLWTIRTLHRNPDKVLGELSQKYGAICMLWLGSWPCVVISKAKVAHELLHKRGAISASRPEHNTLRTSNAQGRLVLTPAGDELRLLRRVIHNTLGQQQSVSSREVKELESATFLDQFLHEPSGFLESTKRYALSIMCTATYGVRLASAKHPVVIELYSIWDQLLQDVQPGTLLLPDTFPIIIKLPTWMQPWLGLAKRLTIRESKVHMTFIRDVKNQEAVMSASDCYGKTLLKWQEAKNIDDGLVFGILGMLIGAGSDTTSTVLQNFFNIMALHSHVSASAQQELDLVVGRSRLPIWEDQVYLPYCRALIKEVHRWAPIGSLGVPHGITEDVFNEGQFIPKGTIVIPNLVTLNRDQDRYSNPHVLDPTRFLDDDTDAFTSALWASHMQRDHFHYGFGRRLCQGIHFAEDSLFIAMSRILWAFDIKQLPDHPLSMADKVWAFTTRPKPYKISLTCRDSEAVAAIKDEVQRTGSDLETI